MSEESPGFVRGMQTRGRGIETEEDRNKLGFRLGGLGNSVLSRSIEAVGPAKSPTRSEDLCSRALLSQWNARFKFPGTRVLVPATDPIDLYQLTFGQYLRIPNLCLVAGIDCVVGVGSFRRVSPGSLRLMMTGSTGVAKEWPSSSTKLWIETRRSLPALKATRIKVLSVPSLQTPKPCWK
jgi:hypothetical protein